MTNIQAAIDCINGYLDALSTTGFYDDEEFNEFEGAINILIDAALGSENK